MNRSSRARGGAAIFPPSIFHSYPPFPFPLSSRQSAAPLSLPHSGGLAPSFLPSISPRQPRYPLHPVVADIGGSPLGGRKAWMGDIQRGVARDREAHDH